MRVLLVDDSATIRLITAGYLAQLGICEVIQAENGRAALEQVVRFQPKFIVTDWNMPEMSGSEFVQQLRAAGYKTPVLMVTTESEKSRVVEAVQAGINNYMIKPFKREEFMQRFLATCKKFNLKVPYPNGDCPSALAA